MLQFALLSLRLSLLSLRLSHLLSISLRLSLRLSISLAAAPLLISAGRTGAVGWCRGLALTLPGDRV